jgi:putative transposase
MKCQFGYRKFSYRGVAKNRAQVSVLLALAHLFIARTHSDTCPELVAVALRDWNAAVGAKTAYIEPGSPREIGYCESFNSKLRNVLLNGKMFYIRGTDRDRN